MLAEQSAEVSDGEGTSSRLLPYLAAAFPDELFGNLLTRQMALNAVPLFVTFSQRLKLTANIKSPVADPLNGPAYLDELAPHLLCTPKRLINEFTTYSYWATFAPADPALSVVGRLSPALLRVCPACIRDDLRKCVPYFHREHQLRSRACAKHGVQLLDRCPDCDKPICVASEMRTLLRLRCSCGSLLSDDRHERTMGKVWHRLAVLSSNALRAARSDLELSLLRHVVVDIAKKRIGLSAVQSLRQVLESSFGDEGLEWLLKRPGELLTDARGRRLFGATTLAPHLCLAVLAACNVTFEKAAAAVSSARLSALKSSGNTRSKPKWNAFSNITLAEAKATCLEFRKESRPFSELRYHRTKAFWMLVINEQKWFLEHAWGPRASEIILRPTPSIEEDRLTIQDRGSRVFHRQEAVARAYSRDREWHNTLVPQRPRPVDQLSAIVDALELAKAKHISQPGRPSKWTVMAAASAIGTPVKTLLAQAQLYKEIRVLVPEESDEFAMRKMAWCIQQCKDRALDVTTANIWRHVLGLRTGGPDAKHARAFKLLTGQA